MTRCVIKVPLIRVLTILLKGFKTQAEYYSEGLRNFRFAYCATRQAPPAPEYHSEVVNTVFRLHCRPIVLLLLQTTHF